MVGGSHPCETVGLTRAWVCPDLVPLAARLYGCWKAAREMSEDLREQVGVIVAGVVGTIPCVYCREPIAAGTFVYWSSARRLLSAACPACERQVTLPAATWRRRSGGSDVAVTAAGPFIGGHQ